MQVPSYVVSDAHAQSNRPRRSSMAMSNRIISLLIVLLLTATSVHAQRRWDGKEKHWYKDWLWWIGEGVITGAFVADAHSTALARDRCPACREANPFLGPHPSNR